nr:hypothetical protein [uncultured Desulfobacter sp.]
MGHQDNGRHAKKAGGQLDQALAQTILQAGKNGRLTCASAHRLAKAQNCSPKQIRIQADLLELRIAQCQLGLFGHGKGQKRFNSDTDITPELKNRILDAQHDGIIDCKVCWELAKEFKISRINMGSACERLEIRIKSCQLGLL